MQSRVFSALFGALPLPVLVVRKDNAMSVVYLNQTAKTNLLPAAQHGRADQFAGDAGTPLERILRFQNPNKFTVFKSSLEDMDSVDGMTVAFLSALGSVQIARAYAASALFEDEAYYVICLAVNVERGRDETRIVGRMLHASYHVAGAEQSIHSVLQLAGSHAGASHAFIFEDMPDGSIRNTYEWVAAGAAPFIQDLQNLSPRDYARSLLMASGGLVATDDVGTLPNNATMLKMGLKSFAVLTLHQDDKPLGFIGFDDCEKHRVWSPGDIQLLKNTAGLVSALLSRRNAERQSRRSEDIFRTVVDNLEELVYITDIDTFELKFVSKSLARTLGCEAADVVGRRCWEVLQRGQGGPCAYCPVPQLLARGHDDTTSHVSELHNSGTGKWYMAKNNIVNWIDGNPVHFGALVDISYRKQYEEQLKRFAAIDSMTDVYNRKWGQDKLHEHFSASRGVRANQTLCFFDIDGLKRVNDTLGHALGDEMIINTIRTIFSCIRKDDFIIRWGGDEFVVFLNCDTKDAEKVLGKIFFGFEHFNSTRNRPYRISVSAGLVNFAEPFANLDDLISEADRRMYQNKLRKRDRPDVFLRS